MSEPRDARLRRALVADLVSGGFLCSDELIEAFTATPRHLFVPHAYADGADRDGWLAQVYSDDSLVTQRRSHQDPGVPVPVPTSSSTMPSLMARMLELLDLRSGMRVLEIGTGTGYNAALLSYLLGDDNIVSVDLDATLVDQALGALASVGLAPTLIAADGRYGARSQAPFDRIIATAAVPEIPPAWIEQLAPGGRILANLRGDLHGGALCLLTKHGTDDEVIGPILPIGGDFMWLRPSVDDPHAPHERQRASLRKPSVRTVTGQDPAGIDVDDERFRFLLQLEMRGVRSLTRAPAYDPSTREERNAVVVTTGDDRAEAFLNEEPDGTHRVVQTYGRLWDTVEAAWSRYESLERPSPDRFGVVANHPTQFVWLDHDENWARWPLPLV